MGDKAAPVAAKPAPKSTPTLSKAKAGMIQRKCACGGTPGTSGMCPACEEKKKQGLQRKAAGPTSMAVPSLVNSVIGSPGRPLDPVTRGSMENRFGHDLSGVRLHTDSRAAESARAVNAHAYTVGQNIAFDHGKYDPVSPGGQHLLAHELAHTIQQGGLQRSPNTSLEVTPQYSALEHEADRAAAAVTSGHAAPSIGRVDSPMLSRQVGTQSAPPAGAVTTTSTPAPITGATTTASNPSAPNPVPGASALAATPTDLDQAKLTQAGVTQILDTDPPGGIYRLFVINQLELPAEKGPFAMDIYQRMADNNQLRSTIQFPSGGASTRPSAGAAQARDRTGTLQRSWLQRVNWNPQRAASYWGQLGGKVQPTFTPKLASDVLCDMDHIVELQLGGTNVPDNVQVLDPSPNRSSGSNLFNWLVDKATLIREAHPTTNRPTRIMMQFQRVAPIGTLPTCAAYTGAAPNCISIECKLLSGGGLANTEGQEVPADRDSVRITAGGNTATSLLKKVGPTDLNEPLNRNMQQLVPGFLLDTYTKGVAGQPDRVAARVDSGRFVGRGGRTTTAVPLNVTAQPNPIFKSEGDAGAKTLSFLNMTNPVMRFNYPYLSPGNLRLAYDPAAGFSGSGTLQSDKPLLRNLAINLALGPDSLSATLAANTAAWRPLGPARVTRAELGATLLPQLGGQGNLDIAFGSGANPYATANLNVTANPAGISASGTIDAHIPMVNEARGQVNYRDGQWTGQIRIATDKIRIPNVTSCTVEINITNNGITAGGEIVMDVRGNPIRLGAHLEGDTWVFTGNGTFNYPPMDPTRLDFRYANGNLTAHGSTGFTYRGLRGTVDLHYEDGHVFGHGTLNMTRGRMTGTINAHLLRSGAITADGTITYQITPSLTGTVGIAIDERQNVRLTGEIRFTRPIELFRRFGTSRELFHRSLDIPIAGISVGPVSLGLVFRITGALSVDYGIGPGRIEDLHLSAGFNPFDENPQFDLEGGARLVIPASAGFTASIRGALALSGGIASISGGITASARIGLEVNASNDLTIGYHQGVYVVDNVARIIAQPVLDFGLEANVEAEALGGAYTYHKGYQLASYRMGSDMQFGVEAPIHYASNEPFQAPSLDSIRVIRPDIDVASIMHGMLERVGAI